MSFSACEKLVKAGDADRWLSAQAAPPEGRKALMAIYAVNLEIARAPWASPEPLVAQMRLRWWADEIAKIYNGERVETHEILPALRSVIFKHALPQKGFETLISARMNDIYTDAPKSQEAFDHYIDATSGTVMALSARVLGTAESAMPVVADFAYGAGVAALLRAVPHLVARGRHPLFLPVEASVVKARKRLKKARAQRAKIPTSALAAMLAGWRSNATLNRAQANASHILSGHLEESPARKAASLRWRALTGKW